MQAGRATTRRLPMVLLMAIVVGEEDNCGCHCGLRCAELVAELRQRIAQLEVENGVLRSRLQHPADPKQVVAPRRAAAVPEVPDCSLSWELQSNADAEALQDCAHVGGLVIGPSVTSLAGLQSLSSVTNSLVIDSHPNLTSLTGLEGLEHVGGMLQITGNPGLASLSGLEGLQSAGQIVLQYGQLGSLTGLENLENVTGLLRIDAEAWLLSLDALVSLRHVGVLELGNCPRLVTLQGFEGLRNVERIDLWNNDDLESLVGLDNLESVTSLASPSNVTSRFSIDNHPKLASLTGLEGLNHVGGLLQITGNPGLTSLSGLEGLRSAVDIHIGRNNFLLTLTGLNSLENVTHIRVFDEERLNRLTGLESVKHVEFLEIENNRGVSTLEGLGGLQSAGQIVLQYGRLGSLSGLENLTNVTGLLHIEAEALLLSLDALESLRHVGRLELGNCPGLVTLQGFEGLQNMEKIDLSNNDNLQSLVGLNNLESVTDRFQIRNLQSMTNLDGLEGLRHVGFLLIAQNARLASLSGLGLWTAGVIQISSNHVLPSLGGLGSLENVTKNFIVFDNQGLTSLAGIENLSFVERLTVSTNRHLTSLSGLEGLQRVGLLLSIDGSDELRNVTGLNNLTWADSIVIHSNSMLMSISGLESLEYATLGIHDNVNLESVTLRSLRSSDTIALRNNPRFSSLSLPALRSAGWVGVSSCPITSFGLEGLVEVNSTLQLLRVQIRNMAGFEGLQRAGDILVSESPALTSLTGLANLQVAKRFALVNLPALESLDGLESLTQVGSISTDSPLRSIAGLRNLKYAPGGITLSFPEVASLTGLGSLLQCRELRVQSFVGIASRMEFLGGPFAAGAEIGKVVIDEALWPPCITPHEHMALVSAITDVAQSSIPIASWELWDTQCERERRGPFTCTKGRPCMITLAGKENIFISGPTTGCGFCERLQFNTTDSGLLDLGFALNDEESGPRSICRCGGASGPLDQLLLRGPRIQHNATVCKRGRNCTLQLPGELERMDRVVVMSSCSDGDPLLGFTASRTSENAYLLHNHATWHAAQPTTYQVCWRAPCSSDVDALTCPDPENVYFRIGQVELWGAFARDHTLVLGEPLGVANIGFGTADGDRMRISRTCGEPNGDEFDILVATSLARWFDFGNLTDDRVQGGIHHLCWCQEDDDVKCDNASHFTADSGEVRIQCPAGHELVNLRRCMKCPAGKQQLTPGLEPCTDCPVGKFSPGSGVCEVCQDGTVATLPGSTACGTCQAWESADDDAASCTTDPLMVILLGAFLVCLGLFCAIPVLHVRRRLPVVDVSLNLGQTVLTTLGSHGLCNFGRSSFPVTLHDTGHPALDKPPEPYRARVSDAERLELLTDQGKSIQSRLDTSMGRLVVPFPHNFYHQGWLAPLVFTAPVLLFVVLSLTMMLWVEELILQAFVAGSIVALLSAAVAATVRFWPRPTPLARRLLQFRREAEASEGHGVRVEKGPNRALEVGKLHRLLHVFRDFIRDRTAYYMDGNILNQLTKPKKLSFSEYVGAARVEWFVSHFWGTPFEHFCASLRKHAETFCGERSWTSVRYWVCFCSNNQHQIAAEIGAGPQESSFYRCLQSGSCQGTCMVLDDKALPLTRIWCIFELLQTVKLQHTQSQFRGLLLCSSGGVLNLGNGSVDVAMALSEKIADMDLGEAKATSVKDADMIREQVKEEMGSFAALNSFVGRQVREMLATAQQHSNQHFAAVLTHLDNNIKANEAKDEARSWAVSATSSSTTPEAAYARCFW